MTLYQGRFVIERGDDGDIWAEPGGSGGVAIMKGKMTVPEDGQTLLAIRPDQIERLAAWARPASILVPFTGALAQQIKDLSQGLGLTPENFVVEAVNAFIQAGEMAAGGGQGYGTAPQGLPTVQEIKFEDPPSR